MKKKLIISVLYIAIIGTSGALVYSAQKQKIEKTPIVSNTDDKNSDSISENTKNDSATSKPADTQTNQPKPEPSTSFPNGLTRENLNGYYKITRSDGGIGYGHLTNAGLFTLDQRPSGTVLTSTDKFTSKSSGSLVADNSNMYSGF